MECGVDVKVNHIRNVIEVSPGIVFSTIKRTVHHIKRLQDSYPLNFYELDPMGGRTSVLIEIGEREYMGTSECSSQDHYCKKTGRDIALGRCLMKIITSPLLDFREVKSVNGEEFSMAGIIRRGGMPYKKEVEA
jgi:hypothetical protein